MKDDSYKSFMERLLPTVDPHTILGLRMSEIQSMMKYYPDHQAFFQQVPHTYLEENHMHALLIQKRLHGFDETLQETNHFLPFIDNWAVCDSFRPTALRQDPNRLLACIHTWLESKHVYTVRLGLVLLINWFLEDDFTVEILRWVQAIDSKEYYVRMACSWFWSMAFVKQYEKTLPFFTSYTLDEWVHNKAIQKACESHQLDEDKKLFLKSLKIKK